MFLSRLPLLHIISNSDKVWHVLSKKYIYLQVCYIFWCWMTYLRNSRNHFWEKEVSFPCVPAVKSKELQCYTWMKDYLFWKGIETYLPKIYQQMLHIPSSCSINFEITINNWIKFKLTFILGFSMEPSILSIVAEAVRGVNIIVDHRK